MRSVTEVRPTAGNYSTKNSLKVLQSTNRKIVHRLVLALFIFTKAIEYAKNHILPTNKRIPKIFCPFVIICELEK